jgi:hypothetical protein
LEKDLEKKEMSTEQTYAGRERRRHRMYVTRNTEYHLRDGVCVAVRDRKTGSWLPSHLALERRLTGGVRLLQNGTAIPVMGAPRVGEALYFAEEEGRELITSRLCGVERPEKRMVSQYRP